MYCSCSAHKSHVRETSLFTGAIPNPVHNSQTSRFVSRSKSGKVKPGKQRSATVAVCDDGGRVMVQEWNRDRICLQDCMMLKVIKNKYTASVSKATHRNPKELPVAGPRTHVEPANGFTLRDDRRYECSESGKDFSFLVSHCLLRAITADVLITIISNPKAKSWEPAYSQAPSQNIIDRWR